MSAEPDHEREWARLDDALSLVSGFALLIVVVPDRESEAMVDAWLGAWAERHGQVLGRLSPLDRDRGPMRRLLDADAGQVALLRTVQASRTNVEALERCFAELNARRDQIVASFAGPVVICLRPDALRRLGDVAPDLLSVHVAQFRLSAPLPARPAPPWLLPTFEAVGVLGIDPSFGPVSREMMPTFIEEPPPLDGDASEHELQLGLLEDRLLAGSRSLLLVGANRRKRRALARWALERTLGHWDLVLWFDASLIADAAMGLHVLVSRLATADEIPPVHDVDLLRRYQQLTTRRRVLLVLEDVSFPLPPPSRGSLLLAAIDSDVGDVEVIDADADDLHEVDAMVSIQGIIDAIDLQAIDARLKAKQALTESDKRDLYAAARMSLEDDRPFDRLSWWDTAPAVFDVAAAALPPKQRWEFLAWGACAAPEIWWAVLHAYGSPSSIGVLTRAPTSRIALITALRMPHDNRPEARNVLDQWLQHDPPELDSATLEALGAELSRAPLSHALGTHPRLDLVAALRSLDAAAHPSPEILSQLLTAAVHEWSPDDRVALEHLAWAGLAWCHVQARDDARAQRGLAEAERCARAWGSPYALLRLELLNVELLLRSGDLHRAREPFYAALERCTELFGPSHPATAVVLARGVELLDGLAAPLEAAALASHCWQALRYIDLPSPELALDILRPLADFHAAHGHAKQLAAVHNRWQRELGDIPWPYPPPTQTAP